MREFPQTMQGNRENLAQNVNQRNKWRKALAGDTNNKLTSKIDTSMRKNENICVKNSKRSWMHIKWG